MGAIHIFIMIDMQLINQNLQTNKKHFHTGSFTNNINKTPPQKSLSKQGFQLQLISFSGGFITYFYFLLFADHHHSSYTRQRSYPEIPSPTKTPSICSSYSTTHFKYDDDIHRHSISPPLTNRHSPPTLIRSDVLSYQDQLRIKMEASNIHHRHGQIELRHTGRYRDAPKV